MAATKVAPQTQDIPFTVQGYVTDPKFVGYQILTNYESTYWRALVGNDAWSLYEVLRSFCHEGGNTCYPSVNLLIDILGLKQRRVLTGWVTAVKDKEYRYPGLIEILQEHKLAIAEVQGEGPKMRYMFHVNLTPGLLSDVQLAKLGKALQKKHGDLLARCEQAQRDLEAKRRPPKVEVPPQNGGSRGYDNLSEGYDNLSEGYDNLSYKQQQYNTTHITQSVKDEDHNNNSGGETDHKTDVVVALASHGMANGVAQRLAIRYSRERVFEKIAYLEFLQETNPDKVQAPTGWLRRAIEEDYGAPDGFVSGEERERLAAEQERQAQEEEARALAVKKDRQSWHAQIQAERESAICKMQEEHGTTQEDRIFWEQAQQEFRYALREDMAALLREAWILKMDQDSVVIGVSNEAQWRQLQHPGIQKMIERALAKAAGRKVGFKTEVIGRPTA